MHSKLSSQNAARPFVLTSQPWRLSSAVMLPTVPEDRLIDAYGRLAPNADAGRATAELTGLMLQVREAHPGL